MALVVLVMSKGLKSPNWYREDDYPSGYPWSYPVDPVFQMPILARIEPRDVPRQLVSFDNRKASDCPGETALHFFKDDYKFDAFMRNPLSYVGRFIEFPGILSPDSTITSGMPSWRIAERIWKSRAASAVLEARGWLVFPTVRWNSSFDYEVAVAGIPRHSAIAVSNYGSARDPNSKAEFIKGLQYVIAELQPHTVLLYGVWMEELEIYANSGTNIVLCIANGHLRKPSHNGSRVPEKELSLF